MRFRVCKWLCNIICQLGLYQQLQWSLSELIFREAVEHFLSALHLQERSRGPKGERSVMSDNIWSTLRMTLSLMGRTDLTAVCDSKDLPHLNKEFGIDT